MRLGACFAAALGEFWRRSAKLKFKIAGVRWPKDFTVLGPIGIRQSRGGRISIGRNVVIVGSSTFNRAGVNHPTQLVADGGDLVIGNNVGVSGCVLFAREHVNVGDFAMLGANSKVFDNDFHPIDFMERRQNSPAQTKPVIIENDVWVAASAIVLKGVTVGARSVVGAGSVLTRSIPSDVVAAGTPARVVRRLQNESTR